jgi:hypothetical protein
MRESIKVGDNAYEVILDDTPGKPFVFKALRHGAEWVDLIGDNLSLAMFYRIRELEEQQNKALISKRALDRLCELSMTTVEQAEDYIKSIDEKLKRIEDGEDIYMYGMYDSVLDIIPCKLQKVINREKGIVLVSGHGDGRVLNVTKVLFKEELHTKA